MGERRWGAPQGGVVGAATALFGVVAASALGLTLGVLGCSAAGVARAADPHTQLETAGRDPPARADGAEVLHPAVLAARSRWREAATTHAEAEAALAEADTLLAEAAAAEAQANDVLDTELAALAEREEELAAAEAALADAEAARATAEGDLMAALRDVDRAGVVVHARTEDLGVATAAAYRHGDPTVQVFDSMLAALHRGVGISQLLATGVQLRWVTEDAGKQLREAEGSLAEREQQLAHALAVLERRRRAEQAAEDAVAEAEDALALQQERADKAAAVHERAVRELAAAEAVHAEASTALAEAHTALENAIAAAHGLGWLAGAPGGRGLSWPVDGAPGSGFGVRNHPVLGEQRMHLGVDVGAPTGTPVVAAAAGTVTHAGGRGGYGLTVVIDHGDGRATLYAHLSHVAVRAGQRVGEAQLIGRVGSTGMSTGPHLHFEVHRRGQPVDPMSQF